MKYWKLGTDVENFQCLKEFPNFEFEDSKFDGRSKINDWHELELVIRFPKDDLPLGDMAGWELDIPIISNAAKKVIEKNCTDKVEFLPMNKEGEKWWILNSTELLDCIDYEKSEIEFFESSGRIMLIEKYAFIKEKVKGHNLFKLKDYPIDSPIITDVLKDVIEKNGFIGFEFELIWDSEADN